MRTRHLLPALPNIKFKAKVQVDSKPAKPELNKSRVFTDQQIAEVRWLAEHGFLPAFVAHLYGMSKSYVEHIKTGDVRSKVNAWPPAWINAVEWDLMKARNKERT